MNLRGLREVLALALPVVVVQVGLMTMGVVDTMLVGRVSPTALAGTALGNLYVMTVAIFGMGLLMAVDPVISQAVGAIDERAIALGVQRGLVLAGIVVPPTALACLLTGPVLRAAGQPADVVPLAEQYAWASIPGLVPFYAFIVLRQMLQARGLLTPIVIAILLGNVVNAAAAWVLIFGKLGLPALGVLGAGLATTIVRYVMTGFLLLLAWPTSQHLLQPFRREALEMRPLWRLARLGTPIGAQFVLEVGVFSVVGLLMGRIGTTALAGHQVALNLASLTFMVPLGLSAAAAVLVGRAVGAGDPPGVRRAARLSLYCAVAFEIVSAMTLLLFPGPIARLYTSDPGVVAMAVSLLRLAGLFQLFDGIQVTCIGILRGIGDTRAPFLANLVGYWVLGMPLSLWLGFGLGLGPEGLWWGFVVGLGVVAIFLLLRVRSHTRRVHGRLSLDEEPATA